MTLRVGRLRESKEGGMEANRSKLPGSDPGEPLPSLTLTPVSSITIPGVEGGETPSSDQWPSRHYSDTILYTARSRRELYHAA